jgi:hypothetical protein
MDRRFLNVNYDAPVEIHLTIRSICDKILIDSGEKKRIPELYQDLVIYAISNIKSGDKIETSELSGRSVKTIFYLDREHRSQVMYLLGGDESMTMREKYDILLEYSIKKLYNMDLIKGIAK